MSEPVFSNNHTGESKQESGWCSGYHARFTRERSRVRTSHPIFFYFFLICEICFIPYLARETISLYIICEGSLPNATPFLFYPHPC